MFHLSQHDGPVVELVFEGRITDEDMERYFVELDAILARRRPYFPIVAVGEDATMPGPAQLMRKAAWLRRNRRRIAALMPACVFALPSPVARMALRSLLAVAPLPREYFVVESVEEALAIATSKLERIGLAVPGVDLAPAS